MHAYTERVGTRAISTASPTCSSTVASAATLTPSPPSAAAAVLELYRTTLSSSARRSAPARVVTTDLESGHRRRTPAPQRASSRFTVYPSDRTITDTVLFVGRYLDEFALSTDTWAFTRRHVALDVTNHEAVDREGVNLGD